MTIIVYRIILIFTTAKIKLNRTISKFCCTFIANPQYESDKMMKSNHRPLRLQVQGSNCRTI